MTKPRNEHLDFIYKWLRYKDHISLSAVLHNSNYENVAIYGRGAIGQLLFEYLYTTDINVTCVIDRNKNLDFPYNVDLLLPEQIMNSGVEIDAIIVSLLDPKYYEVKADLLAFSNCPIVSLEHLIIDLDALYCLKKVTNHIEETGTHMWLIDITQPAKYLKSPSLNEMRLAIHKVTYEDYLNPIGAKMKVLLPYYDDLPECNEEYIKSIIDIRKIKVFDRNGATYLADYQSKYYNIINGLRFTTDNPKEYQNTIHFFGNCLSVGAFTEDRYTIESQLQRTLNKELLNNKQYRVLNHSNWRHYPDSFQQILLTKFVKGDIIILIGRDMEELQYYLNPKSIHYYDLITIFDRPHEMGEIFIDSTHMNHRGYKLISDELYSILSKSHNNRQYEKSTPFFNLAAHEFVPLKQAVPNSEFDTLLLDEYLAFIDKEKIECTGVIGAIVMNCNPFTLGHKYLIKEAKKECDFLYIFVVEEDKSFFSFSDRLMLVKAGTSELESVRVLPGGRFIISSITFPEYFDKETQRDVVIDASKDLKIFSEKIAPVLGIAKRFVGEEPFDPITNQYNRAMHEELPRSGISVIEIPRKQSRDGIPISASIVRKLLIEKRDYEGISKIVPKTTLDFLKSMEILPKK